jgi:NAD-dependent DNA ligase
LRDMAVENGQFAAAINAEYRRGQAVGLYVDRKEVITGSLDKMTRPELEAKLKELREGLVVNGEYSVIEDNTTEAEIISEQ